MKQLSIMASKGRDGVFFAAKCSKVLLSLILKGIWAVLSTVVSKGRDGFLSVIKCIAGLFSLILKGTWAVLSTVISKGKAGFLSVIKCVKDLFSLILKGTWAVLSTVISKGKAGFLYVIKCIAGLFSLILKGTWAVLSTVISKGKAGFLYVIKCIAGLFSLILKGTWAVLSTVVSKGKAGFLYVIKCVKDLFSLILKGTWAVLSTVASKGKDGFLYVIKCVKGLFSVALNGINSMLSTVASKGKDGFLYAIKCVKGLFYVALNGINSMLSTVASKGKDGFLYAIKCVKGLFYVALNYAEGILLNFKKHPVLGFYAILTVVLAALSIYPLVVLIKEKYIQEIEELRGTPFYTNIADFVKKANERQNTWMREDDIKNKQKEGDIGYEYGIIATPKEKKITIYQLIGLTGSAITLALSIFSLYLRTASSSRFKNQMNTSLDIFCILLSPLITLVNNALQESVIELQTLVNDALSGSVIENGGWLYEKLNNTKFIQRFALATKRDNERFENNPRARYFSLICTTYLTCSSFLHLVAVCNKVPDIAAGHLAFVAYANLSFALYQFISNYYYAYMCNVVDSKIRLIALGTNIKSTKEGGRYKEDKRLSKICLIGKVKEFKNELEKRQCSTDIRESADGCAVNDDDNIEITISAIRSMNRANSHSSYEEMTYNYELDTGSATIKNETTSVQKLDGRFRMQDQYVGLYAEVEPKGDIEGSQNAMLLTELLATLIAENDTEASWSQFELAIKKRQSIGV